MADSFLFYDLETFGQDPRRTRISQFAAIRTDADLNEIDTPVSFFVRPADDLLPSPMATLVTGITPQQALAEGISEAEAFDRINEQLSRPGTCALGYNTLRFDDEFVRYGLFRNFHDPYEREWRNGNSRWDLLDMLRLMRAMRPDGIQWPLREDGATSFKLEHLAEANHVREGDAHEALSDVRATIGMARLFKQSQPRLWDYALKLRDKRFVGGLLDVAAMKPVLHISMRYPASRLCAAPVLPLAVHPTINNRVIVFDLEGEIDDLLELPAEVIAQRLYMRASELPEGAARVPLKEVHLNKVPALIAWNHLRADDHARLGLDVAAIEAKVERLRAFAPQLAEKARQVYNQPRAATVADVDASLYDGFLGNGDKPLLALARTTAPEQLAALEGRFRDPRLPELLFRYRARNHPDSLASPERQRWQDYRRQRLLGDGGLAPGVIGRFSGQCIQLLLVLGPAPAGDAVSTYFSDASFKFLRSLARHNDKAWFNDHRQQYEDHVRQPFLRLLGDLQPALAEVSEHFRADTRGVGGSLFRIHRDARFSNDKSPYKTWQGARLFHERRREVAAPSFYVHLQPGESFVGAGLWHPEPETQRRVRHFILDNPGSWKAAAHAPALRKRFDFEESEKLVRPPRGFPADFEFIDDLKHRNWVMWRSLDDATMTGPRLLSTLGKDLAGLGPFVDYLCAALDLEF